MAEKYLIPDDWNGKDWQCIQIQWPRSIQFNALLRGMLYTLSRGRSWDETTGSIKDVQTIGRAIFNRNNPFVRCSADDSIDNLSAGINGCADCGNSDCSDCSDQEGECLEMGGCCISDLKWLDGKLIMFRCGVWVEVEGGGPIANDGIAAEDTDTELEPDDPSDPVQVANFACAKATASVEIIWKVMESILDRYDGVPWNVIHNVESDTGLDLDNKHVAIAVLGLLGAGILGGILPSDIEEIVTREQKAEWICWLAPQLDGTVSTCTEQDVTALLRIPYHGGHDILEQGYIDACVRAVGESGYNQVMRLACGDPTFDCTCPNSPPVIPVEYDWIHDYDFKIDDYGWVTEAGSSYVQGQGFVNEDVIQYDTLPSASRQMNVGSASVLKFIQLEVTWPSAGTYAGDDVLVTQSGQGIYMHHGAWRDVSPIATVVDLQLGIGTPTLIVWTGQKTDAQSTGVAKFTRLIIAGTGADPFEGDPV